MIRFISVKGTVLVDDRRTGATQLARNGLTLDVGGDYVIATTPTSRAEITLKGRAVLLPESCFLRVRPDRAWWDRHREGFRGDARRFLGRIWARVVRGDHDPDAAQVVVGIRG